MRVALKPSFFVEGEGLTPSYRGIDGWDRFSKATFREPRVYPFPTQPLDSANTEASAGLRASSDMDDGVAKFGENRHSSIMSRSPCTYQHTSDPENC